MIVPEFLSSGQKARNKPALSVRGSEGIKTDLDHYRGLTDLAGRGIIAIAWALNRKRNHQLRSHRRRSLASESEPPARKSNLRKRSASFVTRSSGIATMSSVLLSVG